MPLPPEADFRRHCWGLSTSFAVSFSLSVPFYLSFFLSVSFSVSFSISFSFSFSATGTGSFTDRNACPRGEVRTLSFFLRICHSFQKLFARLWMITRSGWHPVTFTYSLAKWSSKVVFQALKSLLENFSLDHLVYTDSMTDSWQATNLIWPLISLPLPKFVPIRLQTGPRMRTV